MRDSLRIHTPFTMLPEKGTSVSEWPAGGHSQPLDRGGCIWHTDVHNGTVCNGAGSLLAS